MSLQQWYLSFNFQSSGIGFDEWVSLFTLCLAPVVVHLAIGVPEPTYLHDRPIKWHDRICHYNPTSILWRYFAIVDRRIRVRNWTALDMGASNAIFWTTHGWDGSEAMMIESRASCVRCPKNTRIKLLSQSAAKTLIITLQGAQAAYTFIKGAKNLAELPMRLALDDIFAPIAVLGLYRLLASLWLTDNYFYDREDYIGSDKSSTRSGMNRTLSALPPVPGTYAPPQPNMTIHFRHRNEWRGIVWRIIFLAFIASMLLMPVAFIIPLRSGQFLTATLLFMNIFYVIFFTITLFCTARCVFTKRSTSTVIPYISHMWYKVYTCFIFIYMIFIVVIAALETRRTPCGEFTTFPVQIVVPDPPRDYDLKVCGGFKSFENATAGAFGMASRDFNMMGMQTISAFTGWCQGMMGSMTEALVVNGSSVTVMNVNQTLAKS